MDRIKEMIIVFGFGSLTYSLIEILFRGHTHWTMLLTGGMVFCALYFIFNIFQNENIFKMGFMGAALITTVEYAVGCIVNVALKMKVWDYSGKAFNLFGQICPAYFFAWFALSIPVFYIATGLKNLFKSNFQENHHYSRSQTK